MICNSSYAYADIRDSIEDPNKYYTNNVTRQRSCLIGRETNTRLLYASSSAVEKHTGKIHTL